MSDIWRAQCLCTLQPGLFNDHLRMLDVRFARVPAVFGRDEPVQHLDLLRALFLVSDNVCRDFELFIEQGVLSTKVFHVGGRHEVIPVYHHDKITFLANMHVFPRPLGIRSCTTSRCSMSASVWLRTSCRTSTQKVLPTFFRSRVFCPLHQAPQTVKMCLAL